MPREKGRALLPRHKLSYQRTRALDLFVLDTDGQSNLLIILCVNGRDHVSVFVMQIFESFCNTHGILEQ